MKNKIKTENNNCPNCSNKGKKLKESAVTVGSLVKDERLNVLGNKDNFIFCADSNCEIVYFKEENNEKIFKNEVKVPVFQKETSDNNRFACYCFEYSVVDIENDIKKNNRNTNIPDDIASKCREGKDACAKNNPQGSCCLGNVRKVIKNTQETLGFAESAIKNIPECCTEELREEELTKEKKSYFAFGALFTAVLSSVCCWLPLSLAIFGASAAGVSAFFEKYRMFFLGLTSIFLVTGFYFVYFRDKNCASNKNCSNQNSRLKTMNKISLWLITVFVVLFAFFPNYIRFFMTSGENLSGRDDLEKISITIIGMTCKACAAKIDKALENLPEIDAVEINYKRKNALIGIKQGTTIPYEKILKTISSTGDFKGEFKTYNKWILKIKGMTCKGCAEMLADSFKKTKGITHASVNYSQSKAILFANLSITKNRIKKIITDNGYSLQYATKIKEIKQ